MPFDFSEVSFFHIQPPQSGYTALIWAAAWTVTACVRVLLEAGAPLETRNSVRCRSDVRSVLKRSVQNVRTL